MGTEKEVRDLKEWMEKCLTTVRDINTEAKKRGYGWRLLPSIDGVTKVSIEEYEAWERTHSN